MANEYPYPPTPTVDYSEVIPSLTSAADARSLANDAWSVLDGGLQNLLANSALLNITYLGAGRFVGDDVTVGAPVAGSGLTIQQPNAVLLVDGRAFVVNNPDPTPWAIITDILPNKSGGVDVFAGIDPATGALVTDVDWQFDVFPTSADDLATVAGLIHLGRAVTNSTTVTGFTASTIDGRGIIRPRGTGGSGGGGGGVTLEQLNAVADAAHAYTDAEIAALRAELETEIAAGGRVPAPSKAGFYNHRQAVLISELGKVSPSAPGNFEGASIAANQFGDGTDDTDNHVVATTMTKGDRGYSP